MITYYNSQNWAQVKELAEQLTNVLETVYPARNRVCPGYKKKPNNSINCDEVYPNIFIGDGVTAMKKRYLKRIGVTHVLNAAAGTSYGAINTNAKFYGNKMKYLSLTLSDSPKTHIAAYFQAATQFISSALQSGGKAYVHCIMGVSRSATCVIAFLMKEKFMSAESALRLLRSRRNVAPNDGFLQQLAALEFQLRDEHADYPRTDANGIEFETKLTRNCCVL